MTHPSVPPVDWRAPAIAGTFYPKEPAALQQMIWQMLGEMPPVSLPGLKALLVPHAGYVYSGPIAGRGYAALFARRQRIRRVILLGPAHRVAVNGMVVPAAVSWLTPLGTVRIDLAARQQALALPGVVADDVPHAPEHCLEIHLPFLQTVLPDVPVLPVLVGRCPAAQVAALVDALWGGEETLFLLSTDLSHYLPYEEAVPKDQATVDRCLQKKTDLQGQEACGASPLNGFFTSRQAQRLQAQGLNYRNSGDTAGDKLRVVGYASIAYLDPEALLGEQLLQLARGVIAARFGAPMPSLPDAPFWHQPVATFVTLTQSGRLRGCIGSLQAHRTLLDDLVHNAQAAAFSDPRFSPLTPAELSQTRVEVSWLSAPASLVFKDETEALAQLRPGVDGLILEEGHHRATYLPQVWEQLSDPIQFLSQLKQKAGLPASYWSNNLRLSRYTVKKWKESI